MDSDLNHKESNLTASGYKEPLWSGICLNEVYSLDVLKDGVIIDNIELDSKPYYIIGRFKTCDLVLEHPSLSRFHAVLQYCDKENSENREKGWYVMDLESTHGSVVNKNKINQLTYVRIRSGYVLKFGGSSRLYIVNGPEDDKDPLSKHTWSELNEMKENAKKSLLKDEVNNSDGCMWGMDNNSDEDESCFNKPETIQKYPHEKLYKEDPKKVIKWYFDREGIDEGPVYNFTNNGFNKSTCALELPVFGENGLRLIAEATGSEKKKEMVERCALQACYMLDEIDELYKSGGSSVVPRKDLNYYKEKDYYSSDEDEFYDRTGDLEQKRLQRMRRFGIIEEEVIINEKKIEAKDSDSALVKLQRLEEINNEILSIEARLEEARKATEADPDGTELDEIEKYIEAIQSGTLNRQSRLKLKANIFELQREENLLRKQLKLTIPVTDAMRKTLFSNTSDSDKKQEISQIVINDDKLKEKKKTEMQTKNRQLKKMMELQKTVTDNCEEEFDEDDDVISITKIEESSDGVVSNIEELSREKEHKKRSCDPQKGDEVRSKVQKVVLEEEASDWLPPQGQTGDGRTSLNDALGY